MVVASYSVVLADAHARARAADGGDGGEEGKPPRHLIFDACRGIALPVGHDFDEHFAGDVLAGGDRRLLTRGDIRGHYPQSVEPDRLAQCVDRVETAGSG